jgi:BirA family biotin operon repressor/biotin-[acetyl-CoA-carboxylase] ligase
LTFQVGHPRTTSHVPEDLAASVASLADTLGDWARLVQYVDETVSTNDLAGRLAGVGAPEGTVVVAGTQTGGRGRRGRQWFSPPGAGLYVSVILRPAQTEARSPIRRASPISLLSLAAAVAVAEGLRGVTGLGIGIKWPNDLVIGRKGPAIPMPAAGPAPAARKVAGILAEAVCGGGLADHVVLGFGINLSPTTYPADLADRVTDLSTELGAPVARGPILAHVLVALLSRYGDFVEGREEAVRSRWRELSPSSEGSLVRWIEQGRRCEGTSAGIDRDGALLVRTSAGMTRLTAGDVTWASTLEPSTPSNP